MSIDIFLGLGLGLVVGYLISILKHKSANKSAESDLLVTKTQNEIYQKQISDLEALTLKKESEWVKQRAEFEDHIRELLQSNANLEATNEQLRSWQSKMDQELDKRRKETSNDLELMMQKILEEKSEKLTQRNNTALQALLSPFKDNINDFRKKVEETYDKESKMRFSLEQRIMELVELNNKISDDAKNLTNALKGNSKVQGDWGEMILESILERSGLQKNREYFIQDTIKDEFGKAVLNDHGQMMRPDVIIAYPDDKKVIVDSKVSLTAYSKYMDADLTSPLKKKFLEEHITSIRKHVKELANKSYQDYTASLDFVMMFIPNEAAYSLAMQENPDLWQEAYKQRVLIISPTNLIAALRLVADLWKRENQNRNAMEIADRGGKLYDKFAVLVESLNEVGSAISKVNSTYSTAMKQVKEGNGNLISQVEKLRILGAKTKKQLNVSRIDDVD